MAEVEQPQRGFWPRAVDQTILLIIGAFGFVAALAWNDAIKTALLQHASKYGPWVYACVATVLAVFFTIFMGGFVGKISGAPG